jgi:hypothetical protein
MYNVPTKQNGREEDQDSPAGLLFIIFLGLDYVYRLGKKAGSREKGSI